MVRRGYCLSHQDILARLAEQEAAEQTWSLLEQTKPVPVSEIVQNNQIEQLTAQVLFLEKKLNEQIENNKYKTSGRL